MYGYSVFVCLANGLADSPSAGTGTVMRPDTVRRLRRGGRFRVDDDPADRARGVPLLPPRSVALPTRRRSGAAGHPIARSR